METLRPAPDIALGVALARMALEAGFFHQQPPHEAQVGLAIQGLHRDHLGLVRLDAVERLPLPRVGGIARVERPEAGDAASNPLFLAQFIHLTGHVGGVDQGEGLAGGGGEIPLRDLGQIGIGLGLLGDRRVNAAVHGGPAAIQEVLVHDAFRLDLGQAGDLALLGNKLPHAGDRHQRGPE